MFKLKYAYQYLAPRYLLHCLRRKQTAYHNGYAIGLAHPDAIVLCMEPRKRARDAAFEGVREGQEVARILRGDDERMTA
jgi:hypothetical protein